MKVTQGRILYLDPFSGIAGDMFLGLLFALGIDEGALIDELERLGVRFDLSIKQVNKSGISATEASVSLPAEAGTEEGEEEGEEECFECSHGGHDHPGDHSHGHPHERDHQHLHHQAHEHGHSHEDLCHDAEADEEAIAHGHGMEAEEILSLLDRLTEPTRTKAKQMFNSLLEAEAHVHGTTVDSVHLHEAGAIDAIVEIVGAIKGIELLGVDRVICGLVNTGTGFARMAHGTYPIPAPATVELLKGIPVHMDSFSEARRELVTPTGALILRHLVDDFCPISMTVEAVGYGAGKREAVVPNVLRGFIGVSASAESPRRLVLLESNIDNMNPELYGNLMEALHRDGALDVSFAPVQMKKNRPGTRISVLGELQAKDILLKTIMRESTTLGVRVTYPERYEATREVITIETSLGPAKAKMATYEGVVVNVAPEYESCRQLSALTGLPLKEVYALVLEAARAHMPAKGESN